MKNTITVLAENVPEWECHESPSEMVLWQQSYVWQYRVHTDDREDFRSKLTGDFRSQFEKHVASAREWDWAYGFQFYNVWCIGDRYHDKHDRWFGRITPSFLIGTEKRMVRDILDMNDSEIGMLAEKSQRPYLLLDTVAQLRKTNNDTKKVLLLCSDNVWRTSSEDNTKHWQVSLIVPKEWEIKFVYV